jgi:small subunit ribosomal protein S20
MANIKSAVKRNRQNIIQRERNRSQRSRMRTRIKQLRTAIESGEADTAKSLLSDTLSLIDRTAQKGVIHTRTADRYKSRLSRAVAALG